MTGGTGRLVRVGAALLFAFVATAATVAAATAAEFATPGGPEPGRLAEVLGQLRQDPYDLELLVSFGTSKGGSAGHLALALRGALPQDDLVYSANFYADRAPEHAQHRYTERLMVAVPKTEYLYGTRSSLGDKASFGLDYGEVYKRAVIGVRVYGVPEREKQGLIAFFQQMNDDFQRRATAVPYHRGEVVYGYMDLNCAKTIGAAFKHGAGYDELKVKERGPLSRLSAAASANIPTEMALQLMQAWHARGYTMDAVLYKKYERSPYVDPHEEEKIAFKDLPNRFPSVLSLDFRADAGRYRDYDNLYAMYLLFHLGKVSLRIDPATRALQIERSKAPLPYPEASRRAAQDAEAESKGLLRRTLLAPLERLFSGQADNRHLYDYEVERQR
jgi:hypothetical protein